MKNALDWLVSGPEFVGKPLALLNASTRAEYTPAQLAETLRTMSDIVVDAAMLSLPLLGGTRDAAAIINDPLLVEPLRGVLRGLDRMSTRLNSSHSCSFRMPSSD